MPVGFPYLPNGFHNLSTPKLFSCLTTLKSLENHNMSPNLHIHFPNPISTHPILMLSLALLRSQARSTADLAHSRAISTSLAQSSNILSKMAVINPTVQLFSDALQVSGWQQVSWQDSTHTLPEPPSDGIILLTTSILLTNIRWQQSLQDILSLHRLAQALGIVVVGNGLATSLFKTSLAS